jgi:hypothetical protein
MFFMKCASFKRLLSMLTVLENLTINIVLDTLTLVGHVKTGSMLSVLKMHVAAAPQWQWEKTSLTCIKLLVKLR